MTQLNGKLIARLAAAGALVYLSFAAAQPPTQGPPGNRPPTLEERVAALERGLASVTTRFEIRESAVPPSQQGAQSAVALDSRVGNLERSINQLQQAIQSAQRAADFLMLWREMHEVSPKTSVSSRAKRGTFKAAGRSLASLAMTPAGWSLNV